MPKPTLLTPHEFLEDFLTEAKKAKKSIYLQSMNFEAGDVLSKIEEVLLLALERNIRVNITTDWVSRLFVHGNLPLLPVPFLLDRKARQRHFKKSEELRARLIEHGATFITTNIPKFYTRPFPMFRRNHSKLYMVDEKIAWLGGVNLFDDAFEKLDLMVRFEQEDIVAALHKQFFMVNELRSIADYSKKFEDEYTLYVDTGKFEQSIIYSEAMTQIDKAEKNVIFMSQFVPDGPLLKKLIAATKRGVTVEVLTSPAKNVLFTKYPTKAAYLYFKFMLKRNPFITLKHLSRAVHAKLLVIDQTRALFGSHNYTYSGVVFGTEELMIQTTDKALLDQIEKFLITSKKV